MGVGIVGGVGTVGYTYSEQIDLKFAIDLRSLTNFVNLL